MKKLTSILFLSTCFSIASAQKVQKIQYKDVNKIISILAGDEMQGSASGTAGFDKAASYIENYLKITPLFGNSYKDTLTKYPKFYNVIGVLKSKKSSQKPIVLCAHLDHLGVSTKNSADTIYNGANDDASGITAVLILAPKYLKRIDLNRDAIFALFVGEEKGLLGSKHFAEKLKRHKSLQHMA